MKESKLARFDFEVIVRARLRLPQRVVPHEYYPSIVRFAKSISATSVSDPLLLNLSAAVFAPERFREIIEQAAGLYLQKFGTLESEGASELLNKLLDATEDWKLGKVVRG